MSKYFCIVEYTDLFFIIPEDRELDWEEWQQSEDCLYGILPPYARRVNLDNLRIEGYKIL